MCMTAEEAALGYKRGMMAAAAMKASRSHRCLSMRGGIGAAHYFGNLSCKSAVAGRIGARFAVGFQASLRACCFRYWRCD